MDAHAQLDPALKKGLLAFAKKKLGLIGGFRLYEQIQKCECEPCKTIRAIAEEKP